MPSDAHLGVGRRRRRRRGGLLAAVPAPVALVAIVVGAFVLGRGAGTIGALLAVAMVGSGGACLYAGRKRMDWERERLEHAAHTDPLTGLANRRLLLSMARHEIARHLRVDGRFVVLMLDLDGFKQLNDRFGHDAGDEMLCSVADSLVAALRAQDTVARLGGDEFCVIAPETRDPRTLADRVLRAVANAATGYDELQATIGVALFPEDGTSTEKLLRIADDRLVANKRRRYQNRSRRGARAPERTRAVA